MNMSATGPGSEPNDEEELGDSRTLKRVLCYNAFSLVTVDCCNLSCNRLSC